LNVMALSKLMIEPILPPVSAKNGWLFTVVFVGGPYEEAYLHGCCSDCCSGYAGLGLPDDAADRSNDRQHDAIEHGWGHVRSAGHCPGDAWTTRAAGATGEWLLVLQ
jgi:hypothetical protein